MKKNNTCKRKLTRGGALSRLLKKSLQKRFVMLNWFQHLIESTGQRSRNKFGMTRIYFFSNLIEILSYLTKLSISFIFNDKSTITL